MRIVEKLALMLAPDEYVERVTQIPPAELKKSGIHGLILDLDNTLTAWQSESIPEDICQWLDLLKNEGIKLCLASNTHNRARLKRVAATLNMPFVQGVPKPRRSCFKVAVDLLGVKSDQAAIVGDQMFTDILGGKRSGIKTIMVRPIHSREFIGTKVSRFFEKRILKWFAVNGLLTEDYKEHK